MEVKPITKGNYKDVKQIYEEGLATGLATFENTAPSFEIWDANHLPSCRIALYENETMVGWGALSKVSTRYVYRGVAEVSVYVANCARGKGVGKQMLSKLIALSETEGIWTLQSSIFPENEPSISLHKKCGFRVLGYREKVGCLNGIWRDTVLMERRSKTVGI